MNKVKYYREQKKMTQRSLSDQTGISMSHISGIETGKEYVWPGWKRRLAHILRIEESLLFPDEGGGYGLPGLWR